VTLAPMKVLGWSKAEAAEQSKVLLDEGQAPWTRSSYQKSST
jgi:hypothetical protein